MSMAHLNPSSQSEISGGTCSTERQLLFRIRDLHAQSPLFRAVAEPKEQLRRRKSDAHTLIEFRISHTNPQLGLVWLAVGRWLRILRPGASSRGEDL